MPRCGSLGRRGRLCSSQYITYIFRDSTTALSSLPEHQHLQLHEKTKEEFAHKKNNWTR